MPFVTSGNVHFIRFDFATQLNRLFLQRSLCAVGWS
jgi:hypothetical protein